MGWKRASELLDDGSIGYYWHGSRDIVRCRPRGYGACENHPQPLFSPSSDFYHLRDVEARLFEAGLSEAYALCVAKVITGHEVMPASKHLFSFLNADARQRAEAALLVVRRTRERARR